MGSGVNPYFSGPTWWQRSWWRIRGSSVPHYNTKSARMCTNKNVKKHHVSNYWICNHYVLWFWVAWSVLRFPMALYPRYSDRRRPGYGKKWRTQRWGIAYNGGNQQTGSQYGTSGSPYKSRPAEWSQIKADQILGGDQGRPNGRFSTCNVNDAGCFRLSTRMHLVNVRRDVVKGMCWIAGPWATMRSSISPWFVPCTVGYIPMPSYMCL